MSSAAVQTYLTPEEYLAWERKSDTKHEYLGRETEWQPTEFRSLADVLSLTSIDCELSLEDIYRRVEFREN